MRKLKGLTPVNRILACAGERHIVRLIEVNLQRQGYEVSTAVKGTEALEILCTQNFDLAVVSARLPDMSGRELVRRIRERPELEHLRVVLFGDEPDRDPSEGPPPDAFIEASFNPIELVN
jgi:two-component system, OmpR family, alkaline phosphatase synthesis response regulator PhoP